MAQLNTVLGVTVLLLAINVSTTDALRCYNCSLVDRTGHCTNTTTCRSHESCFLEHLTSGYKMGCIDNQKCVATATGSSSIFGRRAFEDRETARSSKRQVQRCLECCHSDNCNRQLCRHTQFCADDPKVDCAWMNSRYNICQNLNEAAIVCPRFCDMCSFEEGILFRATVGIGAAFDTSEAWKTAGPGTTTDPTCLNVRRNGCTKHYRSTSIDDWTALNPHTIRYSMFKDELEVAWVMFNATGSTSTNWFSRDRVLSSSYTDLTDGASYNTFAIADPSSVLQYVDRHFYVNQDFGGCDNDNTWFATFDNTGNCFFDQYGGYPYIMYSKLSTHANTGTILNFGFGDCAVVSLID